MEVPRRQCPLKLQQPSGQVTGEQPQLPPSQPPIGVHAPALHVVPGRHPAHSSPPTPHLPSASPGTHASPTQQPLQFAGLHPSAPQTWKFRSQVSPMAPQFWQRSPPTPHAWSPPPVTQTRTAPVPRAQQPAEQVTASQTESGVWQLRVAGSQVVAPPPVQATHAPPPWPQSARVVPLWHRPATSQQPDGHDALSHTGPSTGTRPSCRPPSTLSSGPMPERPPQPTSISERTHKKEKSVVPARGGATRFIGLNVSRGHARRFG